MGERNYLDILFLFRVHSHLRGTCWDRCRPSRAGWISCAHPWWIWRKGQTGWSCRRASCHDQLGRGEEGAAVADVVARQERTTRRVKALKSERGSNFSKLRHLEGLGILLARRFELRAAKAQGSLGSFLESRHFFATRSLSSIGPDTLRLGQNTFAGNADLTNMAPLTSSAISATFHLNKKRDASH